MTGNKGVDYSACDVRTNQPLRSASSCIQDPIKRNEFGAIPSPEIRDALNRKGTGKTPRQETGCSGSFPMRQMGVGRRQLQEWRNPLEFSTIEERG